MDGGDDLEPLGGPEEGEGEGHRLLLGVGAVGGEVAHLRQGVVEADLLGRARRVDVVRGGVVGALLDVGDDEAAHDGSFGRLRISPTK